MEKSDAGSSHTPSSSLASTSRFCIRPPRRTVCALMFRLHLVSPPQSSIASVLAIMIASGVLISWPASVTNCFCFSRFLAIGRMALFDSRITSRSIPNQHNIPIPAERASTRSRAYRCADVSKNSRSSPCPSRAGIRLYSKRFSLPDSFPCS